MGRGGLTCSRGPPPLGCSEGLALVLVDVVALPRFPRVGLEVSSPSGVRGDPPTLHAPRPLGLGGVLGSFIISYLAHRPQPGIGVERRELSRCPKWLREVRFRWLR